MSDRMDARTTDTYTIPPSLSPSLARSLTPCLPASPLSLDPLLRQADRQAGGNGRRRATCRHAMQRDERRSIMQHGVDVEHGVDEERRVMKERAFCFVRVF